MPRHLALVPAFPEPVALLPPLPPLEYVLPAVVWIYQHTNDRPKRGRARRRARPFQQQLQLPLRVDHDCKPKSIGLKRLTKDEQSIRVRDRDYMRRRQYLRPVIRDDCKGGLRPCIWVSCPMNLFLDVKGESIKLNFPGLEPHEMADSCVLDITDKYPDGISLERVGRKMNLTMERVRQIEEMGLEKMKDSAGVEPPDDFVDEGD